MGTEENPVSKYFRKQNSGKSAVDLIDNEFSSMYVVGFAEMYYEKRLKELKEKVEELHVDESIYADMCFNDALLNAIELIEEELD